MTTTQHLVVDLGSAADVADAHLIPLTRHDAADDTGVVGRRTSAQTQWRDGRLDDTVGELDEPFGSGEERGPEIGEDAETVDVNPEVVDDPRELINLFGTVELGLVTDEVVDAPTATQPRYDVLVEVQGVRHLDGLDAQTDSGGDAGTAGPIVHGIPATLTVMGRLREVHLQRECGLSGVHRPGVEAELSHPQPSQTCASNGILISCGVREPCMPTRESSLGVARLMIAQSSRVIASTSPNRDRVDSSTGPKSSASTASSPTTTWARSPSTRRQRCATSSGRRV